jgi:hypothetical protein
VPEWAWNVKTGWAGAPGARASGLDGGLVEDPVEWARSRLGFEADEKQAQVLRSESRRGILNCSRQWGKSTVTAAKALYYAMHHPRSLTIVVSPTGRQSRELVRKVAGFVERLRIRPRGDGGGDKSLVLPNGSRIVALPGSEATVRGFSAVGLLLIDEAAGVPEELYVAVRPMLAVSDGALWMMSTPRGRRGFFYEAWENGGPDWERIEAPATECPRISRAFLDRERHDVGLREFQQEYLCVFEDSVSKVFDSKLVDGAFSEAFEAMDL